MCAILLYLYYSQMTAIYRLLWWKCSTFIAPRDSLDANTHSVYWERVIIGRDRGEVALSEVDSRKLLGAGAGMQYSGI